MKQLLLCSIMVSLLATIGLGQIQFTAKLDGTQEIPSVVTSASGTGTFILNRAGTALSYNITVNGLNITAAHFHRGSAGTAGGVVKNLSFVNSIASGIWSSTDPAQPLTDSLLSELLRGRLYVNAHSAANPGGEIRGQVLLAGPVAFTAKMEGAQENPPVSTNASGTAFVVLSPSGTVSYDVTVTGLTPTAAHFHNAAAGTNGGVVKNITLTNNTASGTWSSGDATQPLTDQLLRDLARGKLYVNAHSSGFPGGEIRGQVTEASGAAFFARLGGDQEVPPVTTAATGIGWFVLNASGSQLSYNITLNGLAITAAHLHGGAAGVGGGVVKNLSFVNGSASGVWSNADGTQPLSDSLLVELLRTRLYVNAHTSANPGGEIRGQVALMSAVGFTAKLEGSQENPAVTTSAGGTASVVLNPSGTVSYDMTVTGLAPTAAHFHNAAAGANGGVVKNIALANNTASGTWALGDATQPLTDALLRELIKGRLYVNAHTSTNPGGEVRGQVAGATGVATAVERTSVDAIPAMFRLNQNYPNPFNPGTTITFEIGRVSRVTLRVYNMLGQLVATLVDGSTLPGFHTFAFNAAPLTSGVYFYSLAADGRVLETKKMMLVK